MILMACDQSVRGFAYAACPVDWGYDWSEVVTDHCDGGQVARTDSAGELLRLQTLYDWFCIAAIRTGATRVGFESYAYSRSPNVPVVELVGACKMFLLEEAIEVQTINISTARKFLLGTVPRGKNAAKLAVHTAIIAAGAPKTISLDVADALCVLNFMLSEAGGLCFAQA